MAGRRRNACGLSSCARPGAAAWNVEFPGAIPAKVYEPVLSAAVVLTSFPGPVKVTLAPGTTAPLSSVTCRRPRRFESKAVMSEKEQERCAGP